VPVVYHYGENEKVEIYFEKEIKSSDQLMIDPVFSHSVFQREGKVKMIIVCFKVSALG
jgi:hypothetical protein